MKCKECGATLHIINISRDGKMIYCSKCGARYPVEFKNGEYLVGEKVEELVKK